MELSEKQKRHLRRLGHSKHAIVTLGQSGLTDAIVQEMERALTDHELVKVRARAADRASRDDMLDQLATRTGSAIVQRIGNVGLLYRPDPKLPKILLPD
jgi:RNA-binding protein